MALANDDSSSDQELLERHARGDREALNRLFMRHADSAYRLALRFAGNAADAEDAVQTAFLSLVEQNRSASYRGVSSVKVWLMSIVVNTCRKQIRGEVRRRHHEDALADEKQQAAAGKPDERAERVLEQVQVLPEDLRTPIWLHYLEKFTFREVGEALGLSEDAAEKRVSRGIEKLRLALAGSGISAAAVPDALAALPLEAAPPALCAALVKLGTGVNVASTTGVVSSGASAAHSSSLLGGTVAKIAACLVFGSVAAVSMLVFSDKDRAPEETKEAVKTEESPDTGGESKPKSGESGLVGAPGFTPTPGHPVGWRGDGSGRYPGATPPTEWYVHAKDAPRFACTVKKPQGDPDNLESTTIFSIKEWLILGPFDRNMPSDPYKGVYEEISAETVPSETALQPVEGEKTAGQVWKVAPMESHLVNLAQMFGPMKPKISYGWEIPKDVKIVLAYTNIYCDHAGKAQLRVTGGSVCKAWFNGKVTLNVKDRSILQTGDIELQKGWNNIFIKVLGWSNDWHFYASIDMPMDKAPVEDKNVLWKTPMPGYGIAQPVLVGGFIYVMSDPDRLLCVDKAGKVVWICSNPPAKAFLAKNPGDAAYKQKVDPLLQKLDEADAKTLQALNAKSDNRGLEMERDKILRELNAIYVEADPENGKRFKGVVQQGPPLGWACGVPCSDGEGIYTWYQTGVAAAYNLKGELQWINSIDFPGDAEHGYGCSPILIDGKFVVRHHNLSAFDAKTGKVVWKDVNAHTGHWGSNAAAKVGEDWCVVTEGGTVFKVADGTEICKGKADWAKAPWAARSSSTPIVESNVIYYAGDQLLILPLNGTQRAEVSKVNNFMAAAGWSGGTIASPLYHEGLIYIVTEGGRLGVYEEKTGKLVYTHQLDICPRWGYVGGPGLCASPAIAGKYIYILDGSGIMNIVQPGREFKLIARNHMVDTGQTLSPPSFDESRIYLRTPNKLYCIGEK